MNDYALARDSRRVQDLCWLMISGIMLPKIKIFFGDYHNTWTVNAYNGMTL